MLTATATTNKTTCTIKIGMRNSVDMLIVTYRMVRAKIFVFSGMPFPSL